MKNETSPITLEDIILLRAYLLYVISIEKQCSNNFSHTEWYLFEKYTTQEIQTILEFFRSIGVKSDCDILDKIN